MIWITDTHRPAPPTWSLTGQMLLWPDGSPTHVRQQPFEPVGTGWEATAKVSRSARDGSRWLSLRLRLEADVRTEWEQTAVNERTRAADQLESYLRLREWHDDDLGVLYLK